MNVSMLNPAQPIEQPQHWVDNHAVQMKFDDVMDALRKELGTTFEQLPKAVFVMKMFNNPGQS